MTLAAMAHLISLSAIGTGLVRVPAERWPQGRWEGLCFGSQRRRDPIAVLTRWHVQVQCPISTSAAGCTSHAVDPILEVMVALYRRMSLSRIGLRRDRSGVEPAAVHVQVSLSP